METIEKKYVICLVEKDYGDLYLKELLSIGTPIWTRYLDWAMLFYSEEDAREFSKGIQDKVQREIEIKKPYL